MCDFRSNHKYIYIHIIRENNNLIYVNSNFRDPLLKFHVHIDTWDGDLRDLVWFDPICSVPIPQSWYSIDDSNICGKLFDLVRLEITSIYASAYESITTLLASLHAVFGLFLDVT